MTLQEALQYGKTQLENAEICDASIDAWYLLENATGVTKQYYYLHMDETLTEEQEIAFVESVKRRCERIPLQYITGEAYFMGYPFKVNPNVLIPRQDTESLVEEALKVIPQDGNVLDMCTGSGCIIISIMKLMDHISGTGADISRSALATARENGKINQVSVQWEQSDLFTQISDKYDVIVSNPPYIRTEEISHLMPEVREYEPFHALDGMEDGLEFYRKITSQAPAYLKKNGYLLFEIGYDQGADVRLLMEENGFMNVRVIKDLAGNDRVVSGHL